MPILRNCLLLQRVLEKTASHLVGKRDYPVLRSDPGRQNMCRNKHRNTEQCGPWEHEEAWTLPGMSCLEGWSLQTSSYMTNKSCFSTSCLGPLFHDNLFGGFDRDLNPARMWGAENPRPKAVRQSSTSRKTGIREGYITAFERCCLESIGIQINFCLHSLRSIDIPCMSMSVTTASMQSYLPSQQPLMIFPKRPFFVQCLDLITWQLMIWGESCHDVIIHANIT